VVTSILKICVCSFTGMSVRAVVGVSVCKKIICVCGFIKMSMDALWATSSGGDILGGACGDFIILKICVCAFSYLGMSVRVL
jgi:hypothetical protein